MREGIVSLIDVDNTHRDQPGWRDHHHGHPIIKKLMTLRLPDGESTSNVRSAGLNGPREENTEENHDAC